LHQELTRNGLVVWTQGNLSERVPDSELVVIRPSGVSYAELTPESLVVVDLEGDVVDGELSLSSDTATHL
jgi:L-ribulose-5-phosphate 4-epimerase